MTQIRFTKALYSFPRFSEQITNRSSAGRWKVLFFLMILALSFWFPTVSYPVAVKPSALPSLFGRRDGAMIIDPRGKVIFSHNADQKMIPASTLKILTALVALHHLGPDYRFITEFYRDDSSNLKIKGYGDPLLLSEILAEIAEELCSSLRSDSDFIQNIILDDSYFTHPLTIPGVTSSSEPYDAPNGALCANFNTVNFTRNRKGKYISAEPQTPLLPFVLTRIKTSRLNSGRIVFSNDGKDATLYVGHLLHFFLNKKGIRLTGGIKTGKVEKTDRLIYKYTSKYQMTQVISTLLENSNNFVANQILVTAGAKSYGFPGSLTKGVQVASAYAEQILGINDITLVEGSGISRENRVSPNHMIKILKAFGPYHNLMRKNGSTFYKTGTLSGIQTRAGYIENPPGEIYRFVVFINTPGKSIQKIMKYILEMTNQ